MLNYSPELMKPHASVIVCTHAPDTELFSRVLNQLEAQTAPKDIWELILVDSASPTPLVISPHLENRLKPKLIRLNETGLTSARLAGINAASGEVLIFIDDDNLPDTGYVETAIRFMKSNKEVGTAGGIITGEFTSPPPEWCQEFFMNLALRNFGTLEKISKLPAASLGPILYPEYAPVGAGMVVRRRCAELYRDRVSNEANTISDRTKNQLGSGGDCEINFIALLAGFTVAYTPALTITHVIPSSRLNAWYLGRLLYGISRSWVAVLNKYDSCAWPVAHPILSPIRKIKAFISSKAYTGGAQWVRWREACGYIDGRADLYIPESPGQNIRFLLKELKFGRLYYRTIHQPIRISKKVLTRGLQVSFAMKRGEYLMRKAAKTLVVPTSCENTEVTLHLLTGNKFWYQTLFCLYSLGTQGRTQFSAEIYDDGTLTLEQINLLKRALPRTTIIEKKVIEEAIRSRLPESKFPVLHFLRESYPHIRKLTDIHSQPGSWKLVLDSDMLFFKRPEALIQWSRDPQTPICMTDTSSFYGYPLETLQTLSGQSIPERVNVGIIGLNSNDINWQEVEYWCQFLIDTHGSHYYLEQAVSAMLISRFVNKIQLPESEYTVNPSSISSEHSTVVLKHYVQDSKTIYFTQDWLNFAHDTTSVLAESQIHSFL